MKKTLFLMVLLMLLVFAANAQQSNEDLINKWRIDSVTAMRMILDRKNCDTCKFRGWKDKDDKNEKKTTMRKALGISGINLRKKWIEARYSEIDEARYAANHGIPKDHDAAKVAGYTTKILRIKLPQNDRQKLDETRQSSSLKQSRAAYLISAVVINLLLPRKQQMPQLETQKFMYLDFGTICPPPNPCSTESPQ